MGSGGVFDKRTQNVLKAVVLSYIRTAYPVGSRMISKSFEIGVSPATVRNIMADLEDYGYLKQPHTSAGRVPTEKGYRFYVDFLLESESNPLDREDFGQEKSMVQKKDNLKALLQETSHILSEQSQLTSVVLAPRFSEVTIKHIKFIKLEENKVLAVVVGHGGLIQNKIFDVEEDYLQKDLDRFSEILNGRMEGKNLHAVQREIVKEMRAEKKVYEELLEKIIDHKNGVLKESQDEEVFLGGTSHILGLPEYSDVARMKNLFQTFEEKYQIVRLLNQCIDENGVQVFIGSENVNLVFQDISLVVSSYKNGDQTLGSLGVIGPTRMDYSKVIPLVQYTADLLSRVLQEQ